MPWGGCRACHSTLQMRFHAYASQHPSRSSTRSSTRVSQGPWHGPYTGHHTQQADNPASAFTMRARFHPPLPSPGRELVEAHQADSRLCSGRRHRPLEKEQNLARMVPQTLRLHARTSALAASPSRQPPACARVWRLSAPRTRPPRLSQTQAPAASMRAAGSEQRCALSLQSWLASAVHMRQERVQGPDALSVQAALCPATPRSTTPCRYGQRRMAAPAPRGLT